MSDGLDYKALKGRSGRNKQAGDSRKVEKDTERLYTVSDFAAHLGVSGMTVLYWVSNGKFDPPAFVAGNKMQRLWYKESLDKAKKLYGEGDLQKNPTGRDSAHFKNDKAKKHRTPITTQQEAEEEFARCTECGDPVFNLDMHMKFKHAGERRALAKVGAKD